MPKVTKETMKALIDAGVYTPRHQQGCPKNYVRMLPLLYAAEGKTIDEIRNRTLKAYDECHCECKERDVLIV